MQSPATGHKLKLYRSTGTIATPTWVLVSEIGDVSIPDMSIGLAELKRRASQWTKNLASLFQTIALEFRLHHGLDDVTFTMLRTAFFAQTVSEWAVMDGPIDDIGSEGLRCPFLLEQFPWDQPLEEVNGHDVRLASAYLIEGGVEIDPSWYVVEE